MSVEVAVGVSFPLGIEGDVVSNYTFLSSVPAVLTVDAAGNATGVASGLAHVAITRKSDGYVQRLCFKVLGASPFTVLVNGAVYGE